MIHLSPRTRCRLFLAAGRASLLLVAAVAPGACGLLPSEPPTFEQTYVVQAASLNLSAVDLAPDSVTLNADSSAFEFVSDSTTFQASLGQMCSACWPVNGTTVAKPAFTHTFTSTIPTTPQLLAASIAGGNIRLLLGNGLNFDPIRPSASARGTIVMTFRRGTTTVANLTINGTTTAFAPGTILSDSAALTPFNFNGPLTVDVTVTSPAGDPVTIDTSDFIVVQGGPLRASISQITVNVASQNFAVEGPLDLRETKLNLNDKLEGGAFRFNFTNPFAVGGGITIRVKDAVTGALLLNKSVTLAPNATSANRIALTANEIASLLGKQLVVGFTASFSAPNGQLTLTPKQVANFTSLLEIIVRPLGG